MPKWMLRVVFSGDMPECDSDFAAEELRRAGYVAHRLSPNHPSLTHPLDDFIEVVINNPGDRKIIDAMYDEVQSIVDHHAGDCIEQALVEDDYVPCGFVLHTHLGAEAARFRKEQRVTYVRPRERATAK